MRARTDREGERESAPAIEKETGMTFNETTKYKVLAHLLYIVYWNLITINYCYYDRRSIKRKFLHNGYNLTVGSTRLDSKSRNTKLRWVHLV